MDSCLKELEMCLLSKPSESEERISYDRETREEAKNTYFLTNGRNPTERELDRYIESGQEVKDFYRLRNTCSV